MDVNALESPVLKTPVLGGTYAGWRLMLRQLRAAARLSWKVETNWTNLYIFALFSLIKPAASALILIVVYFVGAATATSPNTPVPLNLVVIGLACFDFWLTGCALHSQILLNDRERFETLKYLKITPLNWYAFVWMRGISRMGLSIVNAAVILGVGLCFFPLPTAHLPERLLFLLLVLVIGWIGILALGAALAGIFVLISWQASYLGAILASSLMLISGVTFPLETLPGWAASIGQVLPSTLWIEVIRRILADTTLSSAFVHISTESLFLRFLISMAVVCIFSIPCLAWSHRQLIKHGRVEVRTGA